MSWIQKALVVVSGALVAVVALASTQTAFAHVLLVDRQANIAAVLHVDPGDDPVAGQPSRLYFDIQDDKSYVRIPYSVYRLVVTDESDQETSVVTHAVGSTVAAEYTFPAQGLYRLSLRTAPNFASGQKVSLEDSIRISRGGVAMSGSDRYPVANAALVISVVAVALLIISAINNRQEIGKISKF